MPLLTRWCTTSGYGLVDFHVSTYFADVGEQGHDHESRWEALRHEVTVDELRDFWAPVSPMPYVERAWVRIGIRLWCTASMTRRFAGIDSRNAGCAAERVEPNRGRWSFQWGHYSLELAPFSYIAGWRMFTYFLESAGINRREELTQRALR